MPKKNKLNQDNSFAAFLVKNYAKLPKKSQSLIPFILLKNLISKNLELFMRVSCKSGDNAGNNLITSCVNSAYASAIIFFGESSADKLKSKLHQNNKTKLSIKNSSGQTFELVIDNLFTRENANKSSIQKRKLRNYKPSLCDNFCNFIEPLIEKNLETPDSAVKLKHLFETLDYDFNALTIKTLKQEILANKNKITPNKSVAYYITILEPVDIHHVFLIEQFYLEKQVRYRIYQSWIGQATMLEDFNRNGYQESGLNAWDEKKMNHFLNTFELTYCRKKVAESSGIKTCFGYNHSNLSLHSFSNNTLTGITIRYVSAEIDPGQCLQNFTDFVNSHPLFKSNLTR